MSSSDSQDIKQKSEEHGPVHMRSNGLHLVYLLDFIATFYQVVIFLWIDTLCTNPKPEKYTFNLYCLLFFAKLKLHQGAQESGGNSVLSRLCSFHCMPWSIASLFSCRLTLKDNSIFYSIHLSFRLNKPSRTCCRGTSALHDECRGKLCLVSTEHPLTSSLWFNTLTSEPLTCIFGWPLVQIDCSQKMWMPENQINRISSISAVQIFKIVMCVLLTSLTSLLVVQLFKIFKWNDEAGYYIFILVFSI